MDKRVNLAKYRNTKYNPGSKLKRILWYFLWMFFFRSSFPFPNFVKCFLLRSFGARIGKGVVIKPRVTIKYPWFLEIGNYCWIGEEVWLDNLGKIEIKNNVCISQRSYILTGNHDYKKTSFDLLIQPVLMEDGCWVGASSVVNPGTILKENTVLSSGTIFSGESEAGVIYKGNPAIQVRKRIIE